MPEKWEDPCQSDLFTRVPSKNWKEERMGQEGESQLRVLSTKSCRAALLDQSSRAAWTHGSLLGCPGLGAVVTG